MISLFSKTQLHLFALVVLLALRICSEASPIYVNYQGVTREGGGLPGGIPIEGRYVFEDLPPTRITYGFGDGTNTIYAIKSFTVKIGGQIFSANDPEILIQNDIWSSPYSSSNLLDTYAASGQIEGIFNGNLDLKHTSIFLRETTANPNDTFQNGDLPLSIDDLSGFSMGYPDTGVTVGFQNLDTNGNFAIRGDLTSLSFSLTDTPSGEDVFVAPITTDENGEVVQDAPSVVLEFDEVTGGGGETTVKMTEQGPPPPSGFRLGSPPVYLNASSAESVGKIVQVLVF